MHDRVHLLVAQNLGELRRVGDVAHDQGVARDGGGVPFHEVVVGDDLVPVLRDVAQAGAADVAGAAGDLDLHGRPLSG